MSKPPRRTYPIGDVIGSLPKGRQRFSGAKTDRKLRA